MQLKATTAGHGWRCWILGRTILACYGIRPPREGELLTTLRTTFHSPKARELSRESGSVLDELTSEWKIRGLRPVSLFGNRMLMQTTTLASTVPVEGMGMGMGMAS